jgi:hypothetical protein
MMVMARPCLSCKMREEPKDTHNILYGKNKMERMILGYLLKVTAFISTL